MKTMSMILAFVSVVSYPALTIGQVALTNFYKSVGPLINTKWKQGKIYAMYIPMNQKNPDVPQTVGCWSTAFAQILSYHKIQPTGHVEYGGAGYTISEDLSHQFKWKYFSDSLDCDHLNLCNLNGDNAAEKINQVREVARYSYYTAIAIGKDFDKDGGYKGNSDVRRDGVEQHFKCETKAYGFSVLDKEKMKESISNIKNELIRKRPLLLYIEGSKLPEDTARLRSSGDDEKDNENDKGEAGKVGHALVIDGTKIDSGGTKFHLNFGWGGKEDGWYDIEQPIKTTSYIFDHHKRWVYAIIPQ